MQRREFITLLGGAAVWPLAARAQQAVGVRRIGVLMNAAADDPEFSRRLRAFVQELEQLGWVEGRNVRIDIRWGASDTERIRKYGVELVALAPDVILAVSSATVGPLLRATRAVPIVFVQVSEPVGAGFVESLERPGGNATGFMLYEYGIGGKWLQLLKEISPDIKRVAFFQNADIAVGPGQFGALQASALSVGVEVRPINVRDAADIEHGITAFARSASGGLIVTGAAPAVVQHRDLIIKLAARHGLPTLSSDPEFVTEGGLMAYGPDRLDQYQRAAGYVDRILKGEKAADLPVQAPVKYVLAINVTTAKALGLEVPPMLLARADEVIE
jgi:putative tryptophan/tyrosine transport system substrate-binding protein